MGAGNVKLAAIYARPVLAAEPFAVLIYMAVISQDDAEPPRYYGGRDALVRYGMGKDVPDDPTARKAVYRRLARLVSAILDAGFIEVLCPAAPGRNAEYGLRLSMERVARIDTRSDAPAGATGGSGRPQRVARGDPNGWLQMTPRLQGRTQEGQTGELRTELAPTRARATRNTGYLNTTRTRPPDDVAQALARNGLKAGHLRRIEGGRQDDDEDHARQPPLLGLVTGDPEAVVLEQLWEAT